MGLDASQKWKNWRISVTNQCLFLSLCIPVFIYLFILERHPDYSQVPNYHTYFKSSGNDFDLFFIYSLTVFLSFKNCGSSTWARTCWIFTSTEDSTWTFLLRNKPLKPLYMWPWLNHYIGGLLELAQTPGNNSHHCTCISQHELEVVFLAGSAETETQNCVPLLLYL